MSEDLGRYEQVGWLHRDDNDVLGFSVHQMSKHDEAIYRRVATPPEPVPSVSGYKKGDWIEHTEWGEPWEGS